MEIKCIDVSRTIEYLPSRFLRGRNGCPCCNFDLFLPSSSRLKDDDDEVDDEDDDADRNDQEKKEDLTAASTTTAVGDIKDKDLPLNPSEAFERLIQKKVIPFSFLVDTHGHAQLERDRDPIYDLSDVMMMTTTDPSSKKKTSVKAIICAVEPADWKNTLDYASQSDHYLPGLGIHPWYLEEGLPENWVSDLETLLVDHPSAIVGEIGLCKMARWTRQYSGGKAAAMEIQRTVFLQQMEVATRLRRPVTVHCVDQHGIILSLLKDILQRYTGNDDHRLCFPPTIAMHSFSGTAHQAQELLKFERNLVSEDHSPLFYFGFSHTVNYVMNTSDKSRRKGKEAVRSIPSNRLLVESDVHSTEDIIGGTVGAIAYVAWAREEKIESIANLTSENGMRFLSTVQT